MRRAVTIGVYGFSAATFLAALREDDVRLVLDVRLAPRTELRRVQCREDAREGVSKRSRVTLAPGTESAARARSSRHVTAP